MKDNPSVMPLSGGDYIETAKGLQRVTEPTAPPVPKSEAANSTAAAPAEVPVAAAEPAKDATKPRARAD